MKMDSLEALYEMELKDLHSCERQIIEVLPKMIEAANDERLSAALEKHLEVTKKQLGRLDEIFDRLGKQGKGKRCKGMEGILEEGKELLEEDSTADVLDAGLIAAAQHVEHYEIAGYGTVVAYAKQLGEDKDLALLEASLEEEKSADRELSQLAESSINVEAEQSVGA